MSQKHSITVRSGYGDLLAETAVTDFLIVIVEYAPRAVKTEAPSEQFFPFYCQTILHDAMFFEAIITFSIALKVLHQGKNADRRLSAAVMQHSSETMSKLRRKLPEPAGTSDVVIVTIVLIAFATVGFLSETTQWTT